ncbi:universal stress protein [Actinoplanes sp. NPDC023714]|uniref:universal stress protein n=1 Tax=Actinoplanes sp. NPDC023714 TaxID=3154322 RepID=UPI0034010A74
MRTPTIVVATDGAPSGESTVRWAAREAESRGIRLRVVHVLEWDMNNARYDYYGQHFEAARRLAETVTATAADVARTAAPGAEITMATLIGHPTARLLEAARGAELLVVGSRGHGGFADMLLGSVSQRIATHAPCPVVVVRGRPDPGGPIAVGVDDSEASAHVLDTAFGMAAGHGSDLVVIHAYLPAVPLYYQDVPANTINTPGQDDAERDRVEEQLAPWRAKYPQVRVETLLSHDSAASVLTGVSHGTRMIVVGTRGHGVVAGTLLGSTGLQLLHHADCPVYLDRPRKEGDLS